MPSYKELIDKRRALEGKTDPSSVAEHAEVSLALQSGQYDDLLDVEMEGLRKIRDAKQGEELAVFLGTGPDAPMLDVQMTKIDVDNPQWLGEEAIQSDEWPLMNANIDLDEGSKLFAQAFDEFITTEQNYA